MPQYLKDGVVDIAIIGENVLIEKGSNITVAEKLGFSKCRVSLAVPKSSAYSKSNYHRVFVCFSCKREGHKQRSCPDVKCFRCARTGHLSYDCDYKLSDRSARVCEIRYESVDSPRVTRPKEGDVR